MKKIKLFLTLFFLIFAHNSFGVAFDGARISSADQLIWLRRVANDEKKFIPIVLKRDDLDDFKKRLSILQPSDNVQNHMMDGESLQDGYLIFKDRGVTVAVLKVEPHITNKKALRYCEFLLAEDGIMVFIRYGGLVGALVSNEDYRSLIDRINRDYDTKSSAKLQVYEGLKSDWFGSTGRLEPYSPKQ